MKIAVIGSNAFTASHFIAAALTRGDEVYGFSRSKPPSNIFLPHLHVKAGKYWFQQWDLNLDIPKMLKRLEEFQPEAVVNFASQSMVAESWKWPLDWYRTNVLSTVQLSEGLKTLSKLQKYVHVSTPEVFGNLERLAGEGHQYAPNTPYAVSRAAAELHLKALQKNFNFPVVFTRAANVFGPGQQPYRIIPKTALSALCGFKLPLHGGGTSVRSFIHVADVAEGTLAVLDKGFPGRAYHFSTGRFHSIREVVEKTCDACGLNPKEVIEIVGEARKGCCL